MHHFCYTDGILHAENVPLQRIIDAVGTPAYIYSSATIKRHIGVLQHAFGDQATKSQHMVQPKVLIAYSVKANGNLSVLRLLAEAGVGADIVSAGELFRALKAGIPASMIVFSGVGKTRSEMRAALDAGIHSFNVESAPELCVLDSVAKEAGRIAPVALRVNPNIAAGGHANISTGKLGDKFGIDWAEAPKVAALARSYANIDLVGLDVHIGSQISQVEPMRAAFERVMKLAFDLREDGHNLRHLDLGGGLGIPYKNETDIAGPEQYARMIAEVTDGFDGQIILEPGRVIMGNAGVMVSQTLYVKQGRDRRFLIIDAGMNDLMRPALYDAYHEILPVHARDGAPDQVYDVVGPVCESTDVFARGVALPSMREGDSLAFMSAGAYGAVLSSQYNARPLVPEILVDGDKFAIIRRRPEYEDMITLETDPKWMT